MTEPGYEIGRDGDGLTAREREVLVLLVQGKHPSEAGRELGLSRQRVNQLVNSLAKKGVIEKIDGGVRITVDRPFGGRNS